MQSRILVVFAISTSFLGLPAAADTINKPACVEIRTEEGGCTHGWVHSSIYNTCTGPIVIEGTVVSGGQGWAVNNAPERNRGAFFFGDRNQEPGDRRSVKSGDGTYTDCFRPGTQRLTVTEVNGGSSAKKNAEQQGKGGVIAKNNFRSSIDYEIYSGQYDGCNPSRDQYITSGSLKSDDTLRLDCKMDNDTQRVGYCYRWKDKRESSFGSWSGFVCPRSDRPDSKRNF